MASTDTWDIYGSGTSWRWRCTAANGRIVGASTEAYSSRTAAVANARRFGYTGS